MYFLTNECKSFPTCFRSVALRAVQIDGWYQFPRQLGNHPYGSMQFCDKVCLTKKPGVKDLRLARIKNPGHMVRRWTS